MSSEGFIARVDDATRRALRHIMTRRLTNAGADFSDSVSVDGALTATTINGWTVGDWTSFTPSWSGLTVGNATQSHSCARVPGGAYVRGYLQFGSTTAITGGVSMTVPFTMDLTDTILQTPLVGSVSYVDSGTRTNWGTAWRNGSTSFQFKAAVPIGTASIAQGSLSATVPMTWTTGDGIAYFLFLPTAP